MPIDLVRLDQNIHKCLSDLFDCNSQAVDLWEQESNTVISRECRNLRLFVQRFSALSGDNLFYSLQSGIASIQAFKYFPCWL